MTIRALALLLSVVVLAIPASAEEPAEIRSVNGVLTATLRAGETEGPDRRS